MIDTGEINKRGHSPIAAARKHSKFLRAQFGMDFVAANAEVMSLLHETRDAALKSWDGESESYARNSNDHTAVLVEIDEDGELYVEFSVPTAWAWENLLGEIA
jgi:hypothetical protein